MNKNNYFKTMVLILFVLLINTSFVSVGFSLVLWTNTYGGLGEQSAASIIETADGGFVIFGNTKPSIESGDNDFLLIKIDVNGAVEWNQTYSRKESELARSIVQTSDGGYALVGQTFSSFDYGSTDFWLVKTDKNGNLQWHQTYGQWFMDDPYSIIETSDGGFALFGTTLSIVGKLEDYFMVKTNIYGNLMWNKTYGRGDSREFGTSIVETSDGGFALGGTIWGSPSTGFDHNYFLVKTDEFGNMQWNQTYREGGGPLIQTFDGGYAYASSYRNEDTLLDAFLIKTDVNGIVEWNQNYSQTDRQYVSSFIQTSDGGFALAGYTIDDNGENSEIWVLISDEQGIPEFPSWTILPLLVTATLVVFIVRNKIRKKGLV